MAEDVVKVPKLDLEIPKPKLWDMVALGAVVLGCGALIANLTMAGMTVPGSTVSTPLTVAFVLVHLSVCLGSLMLLGKKTPICRSVTTAGVSSRK